nr:hypothetical protein [uncultured Trichococcus sp.]
MGQKGIIKNTATAEISAEHFAAVFHAIAGKSGIVKGFNDLACTKISDNSVQLASGVYSLKGFMLHVEPGTTINLTIDSGTAGQNRNDLVAAELIKNGGGSGIDTLQFKIIKGTSTSGTAVDPTLMQQDVNAAGVTRQEGLYRVKLAGVTITTIERVADVINNFDSLDARIIVESSGNETDGYYTKYGNGDVEFYGLIPLSGTFGTGSAASFTKNLPVTCLHPLKGVVLTASMYDGVGGFQDYRASAHLNGTNTNNFFGHAFVEYASSPQNYIGIHYNAKGRWK